MANHRSVLIDEKEKGPSETVTEKAKEAEARNKDE